MSEREVNEASRLSPAELDKRFEKIDYMFVGMNDDCVRIAK